MHTANLIKQHELGRFSLISKSERKIWTSLKKSWQTSQNKVDLIFKIIALEKMGNTICCFSHPFVQNHLFILPKHFFTMLPKFLVGKKGSKILGNWYSLELSKLLHTPFFLRCFKMCGKTRNLHSLEIFREKNYHLDY